MREIGLFPLQMVLLPHELIPLHIFEGRYKELVGECIEMGSPFGLILVDEPSIREIGTLAEVDRVDERFPDGRLNVVVRGLDRFRVAELTTGRSFHTATIADVADEGEEPTPDEVKAMLDELTKLADTAGATIPMLEPAEPDLSFRVAASVELATAARQELLEITSEQARTTRLTELLARLTRDLKRELRAQERAQTNGRVEAPD